MTEKKRYWYDFEDCNGAKIIDFEKEKEYALETIGDFRKIEDLLNEYDSELQMCREKVVYWRNKANDTFGDMRTNVELAKRILELEKENKRLKQKLEVCEKMIDDEWGVYDWEDFYREHGVDE